MTAATTPKGIGRPTLLTDEVRRKVLAALRVGCTRTAAAGFAGVSPRTLRSWLAKASTSVNENAVDGSGDEASEETDGNPYVDFREEVEAAEALCEARLSGAMFQAALTDPKVAQWLLERRFPAEWSRAASERRGERERGAHALSEESSIDWEKLTDDQLERISRGEPFDAVVRSRGPVIFLPPESDD